MQPTDNILIFEDTERAVKTLPKLQESVKYSLANQKLILEGEEIGLAAESATMSQSDSANTSKILVSKKRTFEAAQAYADGSQKVCVLNFASSTNPGGGVQNGARAQEECLCRCSTLYFCLDTKPLWKGFYLPHRRNGTPLHNDDLIYTPNVTVFKSDNDLPQRLPESEWYDVDVITCAAPNLRFNPSNRHNPGDGTSAVTLTAQELADIHQRRGKRIFDIAVQNKVDVLILGAFGCGAFQNDPAVVAKVWLDLARQYVHSFKTIEFAVFCTPLSAENFIEFEKAWKNK